MEAKLIYLPNIFKTELCDGINFEWHFRHERRQIKKGNIIFIAVLYKAFCNLNFQIFFCFAAMITFHCFKLSYYNN